MPKTIIMKNGFKFKLNESERSFTSSGNIFFNVYVPLKLQNDTFKCSCQRN